MSAEEDSANSDVKKRGGLHLSPHKGKQQKDAGGDKTTMQTKDKSDEMLTILKDIQSRVGNLDTRVKSLEIRVRDGLEGVQEQIDGVKEEIKWR